MNYHVKWITVPSADDEYGNATVGKEVVEKLNLGTFIMSLVNDECIIIQCEPV